MQKRLLYMVRALLGLAAFAYAAIVPPPAQVAGAQTAEQQQAAPSVITVMVPMRDGVKLATDVHLPPGMGPWPTIVIRTPYGKDGEKTAVHVGNEFGYSVVVQDMRGRHSSEGVSYIYRTDGSGKLQDGYDTLAWVVKQPWCNGKIGTMGGSAEGIVQNLMAQTNPPGLVTQEIFVAPASMYHQAAFQGGELRKEQVEGWIGKHGFPPENLESTLAHPNYDDFWHETDATLGVSRISTPAIFLGGWFDTFSQGSIDMFALRQHQGAGRARGNCMLIMGPWTHGRVGKVTMGELTFPDSAAFPPGIKATDWFGYWLKGEDTDIMQKPRVWYYTMGAVDEPGAPGNVWQTASDWPPPASSQPFYLRSSGLLSSARQTKAKASQSFDFDPKNPVPTIGGRNLEIHAGPMDQRSVEGRTDVLVFSTKPLAKPLEVTGRVSVDLFAASSATDTDFTAKLCDVYPDGRSIEIADGIIRAANRNTFLRDEPIASGKVYEYKIDLWSTSIVFNRGHRMRLEISSSNYPRFEINPNTGKRYRQGDKTEVAHQTIYFDTSHPSALALPVVKESFVAG